MKHSLLAWAALCCVVGGAAGSWANPRLEEVRVIGQREPSRRIDLESARTLLDFDAIEARQAGNLFELIADIPGVSLNGGPRANGTGIAVRGMSDNEDVLVLIDGAVKNFEKYRFGGLFIEPELLRTVAVSRGPAAVTQGSGALGGVIEMRTKDAADLLDRGERWGALTKLGYASNNDELLWSAALYAQPVDQLGVVLGKSRRDGSDLELSDGRSLPRSATLPASQLAKLAWQADSWNLGISATDVAQQGREFFDATTFDKSIGGEVYRITDDRTRALYGSWDPGSNWLALEFSAARTATALQEERLASDGTGTGIFTHYDYDIASERVSNRSLGEWRGGSWQLLAGAQRLREQRDTAILHRAAPGQALSTPTPAAGRVENLGVFAELEWTWQSLTLRYGRREDRNRAEAGSPDTLARLASAGQSASVTHRDTLESMYASFDIPGTPLTLFGSRVDAIRAPKLDEYFSLGVSPFNACLPLVLPPRYPALPEPVASTGVCGDLFVPEAARNREWGVQLQRSGLLTPDDQLRLRGAWFANDVKRVLESLRSNPAAPATQPGTEHYRGQDLEMSYSTYRWQLELSYSETRASETGYWVEDNVLHSGTRPLRTVPGALTVARLRWFGGEDWELSWRIAYRRPWTGQAFQGTTLVDVEQPGSTEHQLTASWRPRPHTTLLLTVDNLSNERYRLPGGFAGSLGNLNSGRNIKLSWTQRFNFQRLPGS